MHNGVMNAVANLFHTNGLESFLSTVLTTEYPPTAKRPEKLGKMFSFNLRHNESMLIDDNGWVNLMYHLTITEYIKQVTHRRRVTEVAGLIPFLWMLMFNPKGRFAIAATHFQV